MPSPRKISSVIPPLLEEWFAATLRPLPWRSTYDPWQVWVSEVMLQQTRMEVVLRYYPRFIARFPDARALAKAEVDEVLALWSGLGYYRRARMLHRGAQFVVRELGGRLPTDVPALRGIPGVGRYTAGAIASIAFDRPEPIVDGNVARVLARLFVLEAPLRSGELMKSLWTIAAALVGEAASPRSFNQAMMELGATLCRRSDPACQVCPVEEHCLARRSGSPEIYPRAAAARATVTLEIPLYLIRDSRGCVLMRREKGELMTDMLHLPHGSDALFDSSAAHFAPGRLLGSFAHTVTHRRIRFDLYEAVARAKIADGSREYEWIDPDQLHALPHPSYVRKALRLAVDAPS